MAAGREPVLQFVDVTVRFYDDVALEHVSFELDRGETLVILGAAGAGKTVLLKTALGLIRPSEGRVEVFGRDITRLKEEELFELRGKMGMLFQEGGLFDSLTIEENVAYPLLNRQRGQRPARQEARELVEKSLSFVELEHTLEKFPSELSGGMRRRVGIARAIVTEPPLVLYDSPTAGLDPITANTIIALVVKERDLKHTTTVMVTHRYQDGHLMANYRFDAASGRLEPAGSDGAALTTRFMVLREGRVVFEGGERDLGNTSDPYVSKFYKRLSE